MPAPARVRPVTRRPRVVVIGTGGSISTLGRGDLDLVDYPDTLDLLEIDELLDRVAAASDAAAIEPLRFRTLGSSRLTWDDWAQLHRCVTDVASRSPRPDGVAITHGTATLEETAYLLHLSVATDMPIVLVGAQRPPTGMSSDAHLNLLNAVRVAGSEGARGHGVLVVMDSEIHSARDVTKASNWRLGSFQSPLWGPLGMVWPDGAVEFQRKSLRRHTVRSRLAASELPGSAPRVDIVPSYVGEDGRTILHLAETGARAIVLSGLPPGIAAATQRGAIDAALEMGVIVVQSSRAHTGRVVLRAGTQGRLVSANDLTPQKARVLALLALAGGCVPSALQELFNTH